MALVNQSKAARLASVSRTTINKKIKNGELSLNPDKLIDTSELIRVFGEILEQDPMEKPIVEQQNTNQVLATEINYLKQRIADLEGQNAELKEDLRRSREDHKEEIDRLQSQVESLIDQHKLRTLLQMIGWTPKPV